MRKHYLIYFFFYFFTVAHSQLSDSPELLTASLKKIHFFDSNTGIAFGNGTMIRTEDAGESWSIVPFGKAKLDKEAFKTYCVLDENTIIIGGDNNTLLKTSDKGLTWENLDVIVGVIEEVSITSVSFIDNQIGFLTSYTHVFGEIPEIYKTIDGGQTWTYVSELYLLPQVSGLKFIDDQTGFVWHSDKMFKTTDGGLVWVELENPTANNLNNPYGSSFDLVKIENGTIVASFNDLMTFYISTDMGVSWQNIPALNFSNNVVFDNAIFEFKNNKIYTIGVSDIPNKAFLYVYDLTSQILEPHEVSFETRYNSDILFLNNSEGYRIDNGNGYGYTPGRRILKTIDGGVTWTKKDSFIYLNSSVQWLTLKKGDHDAYVIGKQEYDYQGFAIYTTNNDGASWNLKSNEDGIRGDLLFSKGAYISYYVNTTNGIFFKESNDFGVTWISNTLVDPDLSGIEYEQLDKNILIYGRSIDKKISFDKGQSWKQISLPIETGVIFHEIEIKSETEIYTWGQNGEGVLSDYYFYRSADMGDTWEQIIMIQGDAANNPEGYVGYTFIVDDIAMVFSGGNTFYKINLNNSSYEQISFNYPIPEYNFINGEFVKFISEDTWLYDFPSNGIKLSTDAGQTWQNIPCEVCNNSVYDNFSGQIMTTDNSKGAERINTFLPITPIIIGDREVDTEEYEVYTIENPNDDTVYWDLFSGGEIVGTNQGNSIQIHWTQNGEHKLRARRVNDYGKSSYGKALVNVRAVSGLKDAQSIKPFKVSPNPFSNYIYFNNLDNSDIVIEEASILSITGQVLQRYIVSGANFTLNDLETLSQGVYFLQLKSNLETYIEKIIKH